MPLAETSARVRTKKAPRRKNSRRMRSQKCTGVRYSRSDSLGRLVNSKRGLRAGAGSFGMGDLSSFGLLVRVPDHYEASTAEDDPLGSGAHRPALERDREHDRGVGCHACFLAEPAYQLLQLPRGPGPHLEDVVGFAGHREAVLHLWELAD